MLQPRPDIGPHSTKPDRFGLFPFRSPLLWESLFVFYSSGYLDVSVHQVSFLYRMINLQLIGFPHSEIFDSKVICT